MSCFLQRSQTAPKAPIAIQILLLKHDDFVLHVFFIALCFNVALNEVVQVGFGEVLFLHAFHLQTEAAQQQFGQQAGDAAHRPQEEVEEQCGDGAEVHGAVGVDAKKCLRQEFADKEHDDSGNQGVDQRIALNEVRHEDAVDNQSDVIADQQGGDEVALAPVEAVEDACGETAVFALHFQQHLVAGHESNLQSGEECTEKQYDANADNHRRREDGVSGGTSVPVESLSMSPAGKSPTELVTA